MYFLAQLLFAGKIINMHIIGLLNKNLVLTTFFVAILVFDCYNNKWIIIFKRCTYGREFAL